MPLRKPWPILGLANLAFFKFYTDFQNKPIKENTSNGQMELLQFYANTFINSHWH